MAEGLKLDPLYTIFEKYLYDFNSNDDSEEAFVEKIVDEYISFLMKNKVTVPHRWEKQISLELQEQVRQMIRKKMYGCLSIEEFIVGQKTDSRQFSNKRKNAKRKFSKLF